MATTVGLYRGQAIWSLFFFFLLLTCNGWTDLRGCALSLPQEAAGDRASPRSGPEFTGQLEARAGHLGLIAREALSSSPSAES